MEIIKDFTLFNGTDEIIVEDSRFRFLVSINIVVYKNGKLSPSIIIPIDIITGVSINSIR